MSSIKKPKHNPLEVAKVAQQMAGEAVCMAQAQGIIFESLIKAMLDHKAISPDILRAAFWQAAATIDRHAAAEPVAAFSTAMRAVVERVASGFGVSVPLSGQIKTTTIQ